ncbi:hypothetical protein RF11_00472 [Thelohanellus kitauei]|uniref:Uncharacterized protein n=1 Tax=Thelohanellus kitauei TaxID=669202 RepID=A0A0C2MZT9_THEKT|nr:hypothetical protein RF11_00472 [Thelohanellus kitauei]
MLGKYNGVAAILKCEIHHLGQLHCVSHRKDLVVEDAWKQIPLMIEIETFLRIVYTIFSRSSINNEKYQELAMAGESDVIAFWPVHEVIGCLGIKLLLHLGSIKNTLLNYFTDELSHRNNPISK